jgi:periplasmic protein TonB
MKDANEKKISQITFMSSLIIHALIIGASCYNFTIDVPIDELDDHSIAIQIEKPPLLPEIDVLSEQKKFEKVLEEATQLPEKKLLNKKEKIVDTAEPVDDLVPDEESSIEIKEDDEQSPEDIDEDSLKEEPKKEQIEKIDIPDPDDEEMMRYQDMIKQRIQAHRRYPSWARKQKYEGVSHIKFTLLSNGMVNDVKLIQSSGYAILDKEAIKTINRATPFKSIPHELHCQSIEMDVALVFQLQ